MDVYEKITAHCHDPVGDTLVLNHEQRLKGRLKAQASSGNEIRLFLERGNSLMPGDLLKSECGQVIEIEAAREPVMVATCDNWSMFSRACYHLGNRHVKIEVGDKVLKITPDYVLQEMLEQLGLTVKTIEDVFIPETGAYSKGHHHH